LHHLAGLAQTAAWSVASNQYNNLPGGGCCFSAAVTLQELWDKLSQFGPLRPNGVNLKPQRGKDSYAFVDFETVEAAQVSCWRLLLRTVASAYHAASHAASRSVIISRTACVLAPAAVLGVSVSFFLSFLFLLLRLLEQKVLHVTRGVVVRGV
jgi:hypothetical protein